MLIEVVEYIRPNGRKRLIYMPIDSNSNCPLSLVGKYHQIIKAGCELTIEQLSTDEYSQTITAKEGDYSIAISSPGCTFSQRIRIFEQMLREFDLEKFNRWQENIRAIEERGPE